MVTEYVCPTYNPDSLKTHLLRQTPEDHDEPTTTGESHKDDQDDDATAERAGDGGDDHRRTGRRGGSGRNTKPV
jgi:hypothetical protein